MCAKELQHVNYHTRRNIFTQEVRLKSNNARHKIVLIGGYCLFSTIRPFSGFAPNAFPPLECFNLAAQLDTIFQLHVSKSFIDNWRNGSRGALNMNKPAIIW